MSKISALANAREQAKAATPAREALAKLFDPDSFIELDAFAKSNGEDVGVVIGYGAIEGCPVYAFAQDSTVHDGAVGRIHAAKVKKVYDLAVKTGAPVVGIYDSNGADLREGSGALSAYGEMLLASNQISGVVPQISLVLGTCAGSAAMVAASADFVVMEQSAQLFLTAPAVTQAKGEKLEGAGSAENAAKAGVAHLVEESREAAIARTRALVSLLPMNNLSSPPVCDFTEAAGAGEYLRGVCENMGGADMKDIVASIVDCGSAIELQAQFGEGAYCALATLGGFTVGVAATVGERLSAAECAKIARCVSICDAFQIPVITFVNTQGFAASAAQELSGLVRECAKVAHVYAEATTPKISVVLGDAFGPAFIALAGKNANADVAVAWPSAVISALAPETAVAVLCEDEITAEKSRAQVEAEYRETRAGALNAAADGIVDDVIDPADTRQVLLSALDMLAGKRVTKLPKKHGNLPL